MTPSDHQDIKVTASDALEFEPVTPEPKKGRFGLKLLVVLIVLGGGAGAWGLYGDIVLQTLGGGGDGVPLIKAAPGPVKVRPDNPGGLKVPNRDKLVYDRLQKADGGDADGAAARGPERLLPPPEQPLPKPAAEKLPMKAAEKLTEKPAEKPAPVKPTPKTNPVAKVPTVKDVETAKRPSPPPPPPAPPAAGAGSTPPTAKKTAAVKPKIQKPKAVKSAAKAPAPAPAPAPAAAPVPAVKKTALKPETAASAPPPIPRTTSYLVQLAAARSSEGARNEWNRLKAKNLDLLGDLGLVVTKADLGPGKGIFYRLRAGPLGNEAAARTLCQQLARRQVGCLIIKPQR